MTESFASSIAWRVVANLALGMLALPLVWALAYLLRNTVLASIGWSDSNPTENDGAIPLVILVSPFVVAYCGLWWWVNRRMLPEAARRAWAVALLATAAPTIALLTVLSL